MSLVLPKLRERYWGHLDTNGLILFLYFRLSSTTHTIYNIHFATTSQLYDYQHASYTEQEFGVRLPTYEELASVEEQLEVLEWPLDESLFVVGPPGSGKTVLAVRRAEIVSDWEKAKGVVVVTYNRMLRRLLDLLNNSGVNVSTMHSFIGSDHRQRTKGQPVPTLNDPYDFDW